jgi:hypothetical protein
MSSRQLLGKTASGGCSAGQGSSEPVAPRITLLLLDWEGGHQNSLKGYANGRVMIVGHFTGSNDERHKSSRLLIHY